MRVGIVGAGTIVPGFLRAQSYVDDILVVAISGVEKDKPAMDEFAKEYDIKEEYVSYDEMLEKADIDTVYVAVPNSLHFLMGKKALETNKNVIMEKPFTSNADEGRELIELAKAKNLFLFDAVSNIYLPNFLKVKELINDIGDLKIVQLNYSQYSRRYDKFKNGEVLPVFDPKKAGGALMDLNVYNVNFVMKLFGKPKDVRYFANIERGIDTSGVLVLIYDTFKAVLVAAKDCKAPSCMNLQGDKACIFSTCSVNGLPKFTYSTNDGVDTEYELNKFDNEDRLVFELRAFAKALKENDKAFVENAYEHTLNVIEVMDKARAEAGIEFK